MLYQPGRPYSQDLRERVFAASDEGDRVGEIAELLRVSVSFVSKVLARRRSTGETRARPQCNRVTPKLAPLHDAIRARVAERPDGTIEELRAWLSGTHAMSASVGLMRFGKHSAIWSAASLQMNAPTSSDTLVMSGHDENALAEAL